MIAAVPPIAWVGVTPRVVVRFLIRGLELKEVSTAGAALWATGVTLCMSEPKSKAFRLEAKSNTAARVNERINLSLRLRYY